MELRSEAFGLWEDLDLATRAEMVRLGHYAHTAGSETSMNDLSLSPYKHTHNRRQDTISGLF